MKAKTNTVRTTNITLTDKEYQDAIVMYLKSIGVEDAGQYVVFNARNTLSERGIELDIEIKNFNKDNNIHD